MNSVLDSPVFNEASVRSVNFFNGRLLSAEDLNKEKLATLEGRKQFRRAIGDGIAYGLEVTRSADTTTASVIVQPGLAINRRGRTLSLQESVTLALQPPAATVTAGGSNGFDDCLPPQSGVYIVNEGIYLLTLAPTESSEDRAQVSGLGNGAAVCNVRYKIEAQQFRLISLTDFFINDLADPAKLRNRVAHRCFGTGDVRLNNRVTDPFGSATTSYGLIDDLRDSNRLTLCEVPLAVLYWTQTGIQFVDMWSVRRRIIQPAADTHWSRLASDRRAAEGEAMFQQFQAQIGEVLNSRLPLVRIMAEQWFTYLPAAGLLPIGTSGVKTGFDYSVFFSQLQFRKPIFIEGAQVPLLLQEAFNYPPIETTSDIVVWLYLIRENVQSALSSSKPPQAYLAFASGHTAYRGEARYNVHHWNFGNFA